MSLKFLCADHNSKPHPLHIKSNWQLPPQPSVALQNCLERTKYEIATILFCAGQSVRRTIYQQKNQKPLKSFAQVQRWKLKKLTRETPQSRVEQSTRYPNTFQSYRNIPLHANPSASKRFLLKERHYICYERIQIKRNSSQANGISNSAYSNAATHGSL